MGSVGSPEALVSQSRYIFHPLGPTASPKGTADARAAGKAKPLITAASRVAFATAALSWVAGPDGGRTGSVAHGGRASADCGTRSLTVLSQCAEVGRELDSLGIGRGIVGRRGVIVNRRSFEIGLSDRVTRARDHGRNNKKYAKSSCKQLIVLILAFFEITPSF